MKTTIDLVSAALREKDRFLILTHRRPDGDTIGSAVALCLGLRAAGKRAYLAENEDLTPRLLPFAEHYLVPASFQPETVVAVDIADTALLCGSAAHLAERIDIAIDHHPSNKDYAAMTYVEPKAAATGEIIWRLFSGWEMEKEFYQALYVAVATDTGCFKFSNTTPLSHLIAAECITQGIDFHAINKEFFTKKTKARFQIERMLFDSMQFAADGKVVGTYLTRAVIDGVGADNDDMENLATLTMQIENVMCGIVLTENKQGGSFKASVRTHAPLDASRICAVFGGGGHARAAGCTLEGDGESCCRRLMEAAEEQLAHV